MDGPIIRRFEQPPGPYASGHRGIDYGVPSGTQVRASNAGTVVFAGPVANDGLFITIEHPDGLETLYSYLSRIDVGSGLEVAKGQQIGHSGGGHPGDGTDALHFAMKENGDYIDPEPFLRGDNDDISDALSLVPVKSDDDDADSYGRMSSSQGSYFGNPSGVGPGFTTNPGSGGGGDRNRTSFKTERGKAGDTGRSGTSAGRHRNGGWTADGFGGDASSGESWEAKRERIGRFLAGEPESGPFSREAGERAKGKQKRSRKESASDGSKENSRGWPGAKWTSAGRLAGKSLQAIREWTSTHTHRITNFLIKTWDKFKLWLARQADHIGNFIRPPSSAGWEAFIPGLTSGFFHQIGCSLRGGDPPPKMPTAEQFRSGEMKPPPAPNDNIVMVIGGLGSSSTEKNGKVTGHASLFDLDFRTLGLKQDQIYHYSYKGVERKDGNDPYRIHAPYRKEDTYNHIAASGRVLEEQLQEIAAGNPGKKIDLVAHSEGGLVATYFVSKIYDKSNPRHPSLGHLVTLNSPHQGADMARMGSLFLDTATGRLLRPGAEALLRKVGGAPPASAAVLEDVVEDSTFINDLLERHDPGKVKTTTIGTASDWIVTAPHTSLPGSDHFTTRAEPHGRFNPLKAHSATATSPHFRGLLYNALADRRNQCTSFRDSVAQYVSGPAISTGQDAAIHAFHAQLYVTDWWATLGHMGRPVSTFSR